MGERRARMLEQLAAARDGADLVRIERPDVDDLESCVVAVARQWVLLALREYTSAVEMPPSGSATSAVRRAAHGGTGRVITAGADAHPPRRTEHVSTPSRPLSQRSASTRTFVGSGGR